MSYNKTQAEDLAQEIKAKVKELNSLLLEIIDEDEWKETYKSDLEQIIQNSFHYRNSLSKI